MSAFIRDKIVYRVQHLGEIVEGRDRPYGLASALEEAQGKGLEAASLPYLIQLRNDCADFADPLWVHWFFGMSGVYHIGDAFFFSHGNDHPLARPGRIRSAIDSGLISGAARLTPLESVRIYSPGTMIDYEDFLPRSARQALPEPYTIRADASLFHGLKNDYLSLKTWMNDPRAIIYTGGKNAAEQYAERLRQHEQTAAYLSLDTVEDLPDWGRLLFLLDGSGGLGGDGNLDGNGRFVGVAPEAQSVKKKSLEPEGRSA